MPLTFPPGLSFCIAGDRAIFLDVPGDRYFCLEADLDREFRLLLAGRNPAPAVVERLIIAGTLVRGGGGIEMPLLPAIPSHAPEWTGGGSSRHIIALAWMMRTWVGARLGRLTVSRIKGGAARHVRTARSEPTSRAAIEIAGIHSRLALMTRAHESCLWRSVALKRHLAWSGIESSLVFAIQARPFGAHCWIQIGDMLLNDRLERISDFKPILEVR